MLEEEEMEKNISGLNRSAVGVSKNQPEQKKDNGRNNGNGQVHHKKREPSLSKSIPDAVSQRKVNPQRSRGFTDKRPRSSKDSWTGRRDEVTKTQRAEFGSALSSGPRKMNLNHLINFTMAPRESAIQEHRGPGGWRGRNKWTHRYPKYNKEQFLQANCQFVVKAGCDYTLQCVDADKLVDWDLIEQVRIFSSEVPCCPICLYPPTAAKITRCGHIYCWTCMLHYLALGEKTWRKCPICYEAVHQKDLKSVVAKETHGFSNGDEITFRLMTREKGSVITQPQSATTYGKLFNVQDDLSTVCMVKLLQAIPEQVQHMIIEPEKTALTKQLQEQTEELEAGFTEAALKMIKEREESTSNGTKAETLAASVVGLNLKEDPNDTVEESESSVSLRCKNYRHYASAFSDVELDPFDHEEPDTQGFTIEEPFQDFPACLPCTSPPEEAGYQPSGTGMMAEGRAAEWVPAEADYQTPKNGPEEIFKDTEGENEKGRSILSPLPSLRGKEHAANDPAKGHIYYFYQAEDGQHLYLHSLNVRCLTREHGSFAQCPDTITARIVEVEHMSMNETLRRRLRYLYHLPLTCDFGICEVEFKPPLVSKATLQCFAGEIQQRKKAREKKFRQEKKQERKMQMKENRKNGKCPPPKFSLHSSTQFPSFGVDSIPADVSYTVSETASMHESNVSSSTSSSVSLSQEEPSYEGITPIASHHGLDLDTTSGPSPVIGSWASAASSEEPQTSCPSFAQMLCAGKSKPETSIWPKMKSEVSASPTNKQADQKKIRKPSIHGPDGSDDSEDYVPVPQYKDAFSDAIQAALDRAAVQAAVCRKDEDNSPLGSGKRGKKGKKKQQVLFSTAGPRFK